MIYYIWTTCDMFFTLMWCHLWSIRNLWMFLNISSALERFLSRICFEISCDVFEFTKNLACIVHANRRSQREKYKLTAWNSGQILKLSVARHLRGSVNIVRDSAIAHRAGQRPVRVTKMLLPWHDYFDHRMLLGRLPEVACRLFYS